MYILWLAAISLCAYQSIPSYINLSTDLLINFVCPIYFTNCDMWIAVVLGCDDASVNHGWINSCLSLLYIETPRTVAAINCQSWHEPNRAGYSQHTDQKRHEGGPELTCVHAR